MIYIILLVTFLGGIVQGVASFGYGLLSIPIIMIFLPPKIVVPVMMIHGTVILLIMLFQTRQWVDIQRIWPLMVTGIIGMPFGTYILIVVNPSILKVLVGMVVIFSSLALLTGYKRKVQREKLAFIPIGFVTGLLTSTAMLSPPAILFFTNQELSKQVFRANLIAFLTVLNLATLPSYAFGGLMNYAVIKYTLILLVPMLLGLLIGFKLVNRIREGLFKNMVLIITGLSGLLSICSGLKLI